MDNASTEDLTLPNAQRKQERDEMTSQFLLPQDVFIKNRTVSKENQEKLLQKLMEPDEYLKYRPLLFHPIIVENFLQYAWLHKILGTFFGAGLIDERTQKKFSAVALAIIRTVLKEFWNIKLNSIKLRKYLPLTRAYKSTTI